MNQIMLAAVCRIIVGPHGRRIAAYGDIRSAYTLGLFADYYRYNPTLSTQTYYKYAKNTSRYPHFLPRHYGGDDGYRRNLGDMLVIADACASITLLRQIQADVHQWVTDHLPADAACTLNRYYVNQDATRHDIAVYLADVIHYALCTDPT